MSKAEPMSTGHQVNDRDIVQVEVDPGICGYVCSIEAWKDGAGVAFRIGSECGQIKTLSGRLSKVDMRDLFAPFTRSPFYLGAEEAKCHLACPVPSGLVKAAEVVLGLALPKDARVNFLS